MAEGVSLLVGDYCNKCSKIRNSIYTFKIFIPLSMLTKYNFHIPTESQKLTSYFTQYLVIYIPLLTHSPSRPLPLSPRRALVPCPVTILFWRRLYRGQADYGPDLSISHYLLSDTKSHFGCPIQRSFRVYPKQTRSKTGLGPSVPRSGEPHSGNSNLPYYIGQFNLYQ